MPIMIRSFIAICLILGTAMPAAESDLVRIREQFVAGLVAAPIDRGKVHAVAAQARPDGTWPDIDYADQERSGWKTSAHIERCLLLARAWRGDGAQADSPWLAAAVRGLRHWVEQDYRNPNWWHNEIGVPWKLGDLLLLLGEAAPQDLHDRAIATILSRSKIGLTGQNTVWLAGNVVRRALLSEDPVQLDAGLQAIFAEIRVGTDEGIQPDASFHQHGPQLQWGNYGLSYMQDHLQWAQRVAGTSYAVSPERMAILQDYLFSGLAWTTWHGAMDTACIGRQFLPGTQRRKGRAVLGLFTAWADCDPVMAKTCADLRAGLEGSGPNTVVGNRHFWRSDVTIQRTNAWQATLKLCSTRVIGGELVNGENRRGRYLGQGLLSILGDGDEYADIYPLWDWTQLPGTTTAVGSDPSMPTDWSRNFGPEPFVGGASDGHCAMIGQHYRESLERQVTGRRAWFFHAGGVICLGAGFRAEAGQRLQTAIEQMHAAGSVRWQDEQADAALDGPGLRELKLRALSHRDRSYVFFASTACQLRVEDRQGSWATITPVVGDQMAQARIMSLVMTHAEDSAAYAYAILPGIGDPRAALTLASDLRVLSNTSAVQAVSAPQGIGIVFHEAGELPTAAGLVRVSLPCAVLLRHEAGIWTLHLADPAQTAPAITVQVADWRATVPLPSGGLAGSTVAIRVE